MRSKRNLHLAAAWLAASVAATGCISGGSCPNHPTGPVRLDARSLGEYHAVHSDGVANIRITEGDPASVAVRAADNHIAGVDTRVVDGVLHIRTARCYADDSAPTIEIHNPSLTSIDIEGVGSLTGAITLRAPSLSLRHGGVGAVVLDVVTDELSVVQGGTGAIELRGAARSASFVVDGTGAVDAGELRSSTTEVRHDGVGDVDVNVTDRLVVNLSGVGNIRYRGQPARVEPNIVGVGHLIREP